MRKGVLKLLACAAAAGLLTGCDSRYVVLHPQGPVGQEELHLIYLSIILCAIVVIPVIAILWYFLHKYRAKPGNTAPYEPEWDENKTLEIIWWGIPIVIIGILGFATVKSTYSLAKPPVSDAKPITIQVTSLDWKWLFQYPDQKVATVNYCEIPTGVPVQFVLTSDAPINSFWVPQLGGQEYTMPGMQMKLWLEANKAGNYYGTGANFSGEQFAHMKFTVVAKEQSEFNKWVDQVKQTSPALTQEGYKKLTQPGLEKQLSFSSYPENAFHDTVMNNGGQYMKNANGSDNMNGMDMQQDSNK